MVLNSDILLSFSFVLLTIMTCCALFTTVSFITSGQGKSSHNANTNIIFFGQHYSRFSDDTIVIFFQILTTPLSFFSTETQETYVLCVCIYRNFVSLSLLCTSYLCVCLSICVLQNTFLVDVHAWGLGDGGERQAVGVRHVAVCCQPPCLQKMGVTSIIWN